MGFFLQRYNMVQLNMPKYKNLPRAVQKSMIWGQFRQTVLKSETGKPLSPGHLSLTPITMDQGLQGLKDYSKQCWFYPKCQGFPMPINFLEEILEAVFASVHFGLQISVSVCNFPVLICPCSETNTLEDYYAKLQILIPCTYFVLLDSQNDHTLSLFSIWTGDQYQIVSSQRPPPVVPLKEQIPHLK